MQLPILQVIIPIIASMFCFLTKKHKVSWFISFIATTITLIISSILLVKTYKGEIIWKLGSSAWNRVKNRRVKLLDSNFGEFYSAD